MYNKLNDHFFTSIERFLKNCVNVQVSLHRIGKIGDSFKTSIAKLKEKNLMIWKTVSSIKDKSVVENWSPLPDNNACKYSLTIFAHLSNWLMNGRTMASTVKKKKKKS